MSNPTLKLDELAAQFNKRNEHIGFPMRLLYFSPGTCVDLLAKNPSLLRQIGVSQQMSGDKDDQINDAAGRPIVPQLTVRMDDGGWNWRISMMHRHSNGGYLDGVSRLLSGRDSKKGFWSLVNIDARESDMVFFDDPLSERKPKDDVINLFPEMTPSQAGIVSVIAPRVTLGADSTDNYTSVPRPEWTENVEADPEGYTEAADFVKAPKGGEAVPRKAATAQMFYEFVVSKRASDPTRATKAEKLLTAYVLRKGISDGETKMLQFREVVGKYNSTLKERTGIIVPFRELLDALIDGKKVKFGYTRNPKTDAVTGIIVNVLKTKSAKAGS